MARTKKELEKRVTELEAAMRTFVERCERGEVRSVKTYEQFKALLEKASTPA